MAAVAAGPLLDLTDRLSTWAPGSPDLAVTRDDEAGRLIEAFNRMQNQVDRSIAREREFAGNLSHEVRTPLAAIRSDSELMLLTQVLTPDQRQRLARILDNVDDVVVCLKAPAPWRAISFGRPNPWIWRSAWPMPGAAMRRRPTWRTCGWTTGSPKGMY